MNGPTVTLAVVPETYAVARLDADAQVPRWADGGALSSVTRTEEELSVVCEASRVPPEVTAERDWRCLAVEGPLDFSAVGILASLSVALAADGISLFALSTYDTDYLLVRAARLDEACAALERVGHRIAS